jgi:hypothetical protein
LVFFPCPLTPGFSKPDGANATVFDTDLGNASQTSLAHPPTADDICRTLEQAAAENALPVEFFARVIWQESRFNANAVSPKGAEALPNLCRAQPIGMGWRTRSIRSRRCITPRSANCERGGEYLAPIAFDGREQRFSVDPDQA